MVLFKRMNFTRKLEAKPQKMEGIIKEKGSMYE